MRLFVALDLPDEVRAELTQVIAEWRGIAGEGVRWVRPEGIHITLKFIGYIEDARLPEFRGALAPVRSDSPIEMDVRGIGFFPSAKRPRVMWCGVKASANLKQLAADVEAAVEPLGIARESREFAPHLTLARINAPPRPLISLISAAEKNAERDFGAIHATEFHLYESILQRSGAVYRKIESYPFTKDAR